MAYLNNIYGNAAYLGFIHGAMAGRTPVAVVGVYTNLKAAALAFAVDVDALITFDALVTTGAGITQLAITTNVIAANEQWRAGLLQALCSASQWGRYCDDALVSGAAGAGNAAAIFQAWTDLVSGFVTP